MQLDRLSRQMAAVVANTVIGRGGKKSFNQLQCYILAPLCEVREVPSRSLNTTIWCCAQECWLTRFFCNVQGCDLGRKRKLTAFSHNQDIWRKISSWLIVEFYILTLKKKKLQVSHETVSSVTFLKPTFCANHFVTQIFIQINSKTHIQELSVGRGAQMKTLAIHYN